MNDPRTTALNWFKARLRDGSMTIPDETIYWNLRTRSAYAETHIAGVGGTEITSRSYVHRVILKSNGVKLPLYGVAIQLSLPRDVEDILVDFATALKVRRLARQQVAEEV
jgi:hypothetical protein